MNGYGHIDKGYRERSISTKFTKLTVGEVIDTNDPQQMGRLRVLCPTLGDDSGTIIENLPWASYVAPFGGITETTSRGNGNYTSNGPVSYGMWNIPKVGATVLIACIDGDPRFRVWLGCLHGQYLPHTLPHGRFQHDGDEVKGPLTSSEQPIEPLNSNFTIAFTKLSDVVGSGITDKARQSYEFRTRGFDYSVSSVDGDTISSGDTIVTHVPDETDFEASNPNGTTYKVTQGYADSRVDPPSTYTTTSINGDSQTYSWTTPGFHSISMDDRKENCRIRVRTSHGNQILMDDTNERLYISTAKGNSWIELDENGNIDIFGSRNLSFHAEKSINFTAGDTFRVTAKNGIHLSSENEVRITSTNNMHLKSLAGCYIQGSTLDIFANNTLHLSGNSIGIKSSSTLNLDSTSDTNLLIGGAGFITSSGALDIKSSLDTHITGRFIHLNSGTSSGSASSAPNADEAKESYLTSRVPEHEPWPRVMTDPAKTDGDIGNTHTDSAEFLYDDENVGKMERGEVIERNKEWRR